MRRGANEATEPASDDHADNKRNQRRKVVQGPRPLYLHCVDPQKQRVRGLRIGEYAVSDPAIGVDISAGERQQRRDGEGFLAVEIQVRCAI